MKTPFKFILRPEAISTSETQAFELIEVVRTKSNDIPCFKLRVLVYGGASRLVKIRSNSENTINEINTAKSIIKSGMTVALSFNELSFQSYNFNNSSGISLSADDFHIIRETVKIPVTLNCINNVNLIQLCMVYNIDKNVALAYRLNNAKLNDNDVIKHFRPDLTENILGELVPHPFYKGE